MAEPAVRVVACDLDRDRLLLAIEGALDLACEAHFDEHVAPLAEHQVVEVHVDCRGCTFADVRGVGVLARLAADQRRVVLVEPPRQLEWLLLQTEVWSRFRIEGSHFPELSPT
jgi:anti-anti-sigma regulatory factor